MAARKQRLAVGIPHPDAALGEYRGTTGRGGCIGLGNAENGQPVARLADHILNAAAHRRAGSQHHTVGNGRRGMLAAPERAVEKDLAGAALAQPGNDLQLVMAARGAGDFHLAAIEHLDHDDLAHRAVDAAAVDQLAARLGPLQRLARRRHQRPRPDDDRRLGNGKHLIQRLAIAPDRGQADRHILGRRAGEQAIERHRLAGVLAHAHDRQRRHAAIADTFPQLALGSFEMHCRRPQT